MYNTKFQEEELGQYSFLVTGGAGFIGANIVEYLVQHGAKKVRILDNLATGFYHNIEPFVALPNVEFVEGDITDYNTCLQACEGIDFVSQQAALGSVPRSINNPLATNKANVTGFLNVITAAKEQGVKRLVFASSSSVYGDSTVLPKVEHQIGKPLSPYAVSKLVNEQYAEIFVKTYGVELIGLRYFNIYGPKQSPEGAYAAAIPLFIEALQKNEAPRVNGDGLQTRDFTFVENAVQANIKALFTPNNDAVGKVFNIAVGERVSLLELIDQLKTILGATVAPMHREERVGDVRDSLADVSNAKTYLGYEPLVKLPEGLQKTVAWFQQNQ